MAEQCGCDYHPLKSLKWEHCRYCGRDLAECGHISRRGLCGQCAETRTADNSRQVNGQSGPFASKRVAGLARYLARMTG